MKRPYVVTQLSLDSRAGKEAPFFAFHFFYTQAQKQGFAPKNSQVAPFSRGNRDEFEEDLVFVDRKFQLYLEILSERLALIHGKYDPAFWKRCLSLGFNRYVTFCYEAFQVHSKNLDPARHEFRCLAPSDFYTPSDFGDLRQYLQHKSKGQEQLFSIYCKSAELSPESTLTVQEQKLEPSSGSLLPPSRSPKQWFAKFRTGRILRRLLKNVSPIIGVYNSYFSEKNMQDLIISSRGKINAVDLSIKIDRRPPDPARRGELSKIPASSDAFDRFFFSTIPSLFPSSHLEDFDSIESATLEKLKTYPRLKYVANESWLSDSYSAICLAIFSRNGVPHLSNEHNYIGHVFLGSNHRYQPGFTDYFLSLGWNDPNWKNIIPSGSLFQWETSRKQVPHQTDLLYVSSLPLAFREEISSAYAWTSEDAPRYMDFVRSFFRNLEKERLIDHVVYKGYPEDHLKNWITYPYQWYLSDWWKKFKKVYVDSTRAKDLMPDSALVICDYISTSYIEAFRSNIPCIFFFMESYYLEPRYENTFRELVEAEVAFTTPEAAALFIRKHYPDFSPWWNSEKTQAAVKRFLEENLRDGESMKQRLREFLEK